MKSLIRDKNIQLFSVALAVRLFVLLLIAILPTKPFSELAMWYDGDSYLAIAQSFPLPYDYPSMLKDVKHYPLFPFFIYMASLILKNVLLSSYCVVIFASSLSVVVFYNIAKRYTDNAFELSLLFCCFPPRWLSVSTFVWSEPVFMLFMLLAFLFFMEDKHLLAFAALGLSAIARPIGVLFLSSFFVYLLLNKRERIVPMLKYSVMALVPFLLYHFYLFARFEEVLLLVHGNAGGGWGGKIFSYPLHGLLAGISDPNLLVIRKIYTCSILILYLVAFIVAVRSIKKDDSSLLGCWFLPYFIFTCFLKGENYNWWMISFARLVLPIAPAGMILVGRYFSKRTLQYIAGAALILGIVYSVAVCFVRTADVPI